MSSRALRKAQQRAEQERLEALAAKKPDTVSEEEEEDDGESEPEPVATKKANLFAMLNAQLEEEDDADNKDDDEDEDDEPTKEAPSTTSSKVAKKKKKNKKKKGKGKAKETEVEEPEEDDEEFDSALKALQSASLSAADSKPVAKTSEATQLQTLLQTDSRHLDMENEMRKLFGRVATSREASGAGEQRQRGQPRGLGGRPMLAAGGRRNVFVQYGEGWPRDPSGGLSMELEEKRDDGTILFKYVHSRAYQDVQRQFNQCVRSMDPQQMIAHMHTHPYHISTLLQVSHIATTQGGDHTTSQTCISRALFALGRSAHSVFPTSLSSGQARLSFAHFENRELYFAGWKYILSLSRRGLWRTGLEFIRVLLQLDPIADPLCLSLVIDQYALKSRTPEILTNLSSTPLLEKQWASQPNILYSLSLAHLMSGDPSLATNTLLSAVKRYPWMLAKLHGALTDSPGPLPKALWGILPTNDTDELLAELYALRMGDLWNIPEHAKFLLSTLETLTPADLKKQAPESMKDFYSGEKLRDLARMVFLMDGGSNRTLIGYLPKQLRDDQGYAWDVLPPTGAESVYQQEMDAEETMRRSGGLAGVDAEGGRGLLEVFLRSILPSFQVPEGGRVQVVPHAQQRQQQQQQEGGPAEGVIEESFEVTAGELQATLIAMVDEGIGFDPDASVEERALMVLRANMVPSELMPWFAERWGVFDEASDAVVVEQGREGVVEPPAPVAQQQQQQQQQGGGRAPAPTVEDGDEEAEEARERDGRAIDRLVQILGTGDRSTLRMRVDRMFEGQGAEMADVKRRVEEKLGLR